MGESVGEADLEMGVGHISPQGHVQVASSVVYCEVGYPHRSLRTSTVDVAWSCKESEREMMKDDCDICDKVKDFLQ